MDALRAALAEVISKPAPPPEELTRVSITMSDGSVIKGRVLLVQPVLQAGPQEPICVYVGSQVSLTRMWINPEYIAAVNLDQTFIKGEIVPARLRNRLG